MRAVLVALMIAIAASPAAGQIIINPGPTVIQPPKPIMVIEFVREAGIERWEVKLTGGRWAGETVYLRISGQGCTYMDEVYKGMITPLYEDMTFKFSFLAVSIRRLTRRRDRQVQPGVGQAESFEIITVNAPTYVDPHNAGEAA